MKCLPRKSSPPGSLFSTWARRGAPLVVAVALGAAASACNPATPFAAIVNGQRISQAQISRELDALRANTAFLTKYNDSSTARGQAGILAHGTANPAFTQSFAAAVLGLEIQAAVVHAEVVKRHIEPPHSAVVAPATEDAAGQQFDTVGTGSDQKPIFAMFSPWFRHLFDQHKAEEDALSNALGARGVDDAAVQKFYADNPQDFITSQCVAHVLVKTKEQATALLAQIAGGSDFAGLAAQNSIDATSAAKGGDLGCGTPGQGSSPVSQDQQFVVAAAKAPIGQVTGPIQVSGGWDLIKVASRQLQPLNAQVKTAIRQQLQQTASTPLNQFFQQAAATLKVQINPQYGHWDGQQLTVVPPTAPDPARSGLPNATTTIPSAGAGAGGPSAGGPSAGGPGAGAGGPGAGGPGAGGPGAGGPGAGAPAGAPDTTPASSGP